MTNYNFFWKEILQTQYVQCDRFVLIIRTQNIINDLKNLENLFDFSNLDENHELFRNKNITVFGKFETGTPKNIWIDEFIALRIKASLFECNDTNTNNLRVFLNFLQNTITSKNIKNVYMIVIIKKIVIIIFLVH